MLTVRAYGASLEGAGAFAVTVEASFVARDDPLSTDVILTGLPDPVLRESRGKLLCALAATRARLGPGRLYLNLVPAARKKSGEALDLALVLASAVAAGHLAPESLDDALFLGEVGIDGRLHAVPGGLAAAVEARRLGLARVIAPLETAAEAACLAGIAAHGARDLAEVFGLLTGAPDAAPALKPPPDEALPRPEAAQLDEVRGQAVGKLALEIAAAGGHALLFVGPPGAGKSMLARRLPGLLPEPTLDERIEITQVLSAAGRWPRGLARRRPFRAPHHTTSFAGLVGGGAPLVPGELTLAHQGVLFLDELPEFSREALEALRQPLEEGIVHLARATHRASLPARAQLVAAMNPCPCGHQGDPRVACVCPPFAVRRYRGRISGPMLDRIDLRVCLEAAPPGDLVAAPPPPPERSGLAVAARVAAARRAQRARGQAGANAALSGDELDRLAPMERGALRLLELAVDRRALSSRALQAVRRVARTVADLAGDERLDEAHVSQALGLRAAL
ncbi:MAG: YifB family Mg chelatase-like AAA ATPase [Planctomycetota bacterium]